jgi:restriction endonuclease S subunit
LDGINHLINLQEEQLREYDRLAQSLFYTTFGDPITNPKGWEKVRVDSICKNLDNRRKPVTASERVPGDIPYYGASGVVDYVRDYIFDGDYLLVSEDGANLVARVTPIAFSISGKTWVNNHAHILEFSEPSTQLYVQTHLNLIDLSGLITGAVQPKLNQAMLNGYMLPLPPLSLQQTFASQVEAIEAQKALIRKSLEDTRKLLAARMQYYFE